MQPVLLTKRPNSACRALNDPAMKEETLIRLALNCGADKATVITQAQIVLSESFRDICASNKCGCYGRCWTCPPDIGDIQTLMQQVRQYSHALLYQTVTNIEDSFDIEGMLEAGNRHSALSRRIRDALSSDLPDALNLSCGGCRLCESCAKLVGEPCRFPKQAMPSLEGYGVDVYNTVSGTDLKYINGQNTVTYFGLVLYSE